jgi:CheY-like chemotaxis protein
LLSLLISKLGDHEVQQAHDGPSALQKLAEWRPQIVLLDIGLPGMDGYEVARTIRRQPDVADVLLVALTGYGQEEDRRKSLAAGFDEHLVKPPAREQIERLLLRNGRMESAKVAEEGLEPPTRGL